MGSHPRHPDDLARLDDAQLVTLAGELASGSAAEQETSKRCTAVILCRHRSLIRAVLAAKVPTAMVDGLESDVFARFAAKARSGGRITNPAGLLVRMATFVRASYLDGRGDPEAPLEDWDPPVEDGADQVGDLAVIERLLAPLTERQRGVVWMRIVEGRSSAEVADILGTTAGNVDVILHRSLPKVRKAQT